MNELDALDAFVDTMTATRATEDEVRLFCSCAAKVLKESRENPSREVEDLLGDFRNLLAGQAPAAGYRKRGGQTVEAPAYRLTDAGMEHIGRQPFAFPEQEGAPPGAI